MQQMLTPIRLGNVTLKNRIIFAPTTMGLSKEAYYKSIEHIAAGGCGMIIIGDVPVLPTRFGPSLYDKKGFAHYQQLAMIAHAHGCKICAQLHQSDSDLLAMLPYLPRVLMGALTPNQLRAILNKKVGPYITHLPEKKVRRITHAFGKAAELAVQAGFDMVQVHGDRMCGSFSSSVYNWRTDRYGGDVYGRSRFALESIASIRRHVPSLAIDYKLAVRITSPHYGNAGVRMEDLPAFVPLLEQAGVTSLHVTLANHSDLSDTIPPANHPYFSQEGCFLFLCDEVRKYTTLPICGVGGLTDPDFVEQQISSGRIQCAAMSRQIIADAQWVNKVAQGRPQDIRRCVRCNQKCLGGMMQHQGVHCIYDNKEEQP